MTTKVRALHKKLQDANKKTLARIEKQSEGFPGAVTSEAESTEVEVEKVHSRYAPSSLGSRALCRQWKPSKKTSKAAEEGTMLHKLLEEKQLSRDHLTDDQHRYLEMIEDYMLGIFIKLKHKQAKIEIHKEVRVDLTWMGIQGLEGGTVDLLIWDETNSEIWIFDYKLGQIEVEDAEVNWQQKIYSLGAFKLYPKAVKCHIHLLQPKCDMISTHTYLREEFPRMHMETVALIRECEDPNQPYTPSDKACAFCELKGANCPAYQIVAFEIMNNIQLPNPTPIQLLEKPAYELNPVERGQVFACVKMLADWCKSKSSEMTQLATEGHEVGGYALKVRNGNRSVESSCKARNLLMTTYLMNSAASAAALGAYEENAEISFAKFAECVHAAELVLAEGKKITQKASKEKAEQLLCGQGLLLQELPVRYLTKD